MIVIRMVVIASISRRPPLPRPGQIKVVFSTCPNRDQNLWKPQLRATRGVHCKGEERFWEGKEGTSDGAEANFDDPDGDSVVMAMRR